MEKEYLVALAVGNAELSSYKFGISFPKRKALVYEVETSAHHMGHLKKEPCSSRIKLNRESNLLCIRTTVEKDQYLFTKINISSADETGKYHGKSVKMPITKEISDTVELDDKDYNPSLSTRAYFWEN